MSQSRTIEVIIEVEIPFHKSVENDYGADADGNRGMRVVEYVPETALVLTRVPKAVEEWAKVEALDLFQEKYNS